MRLSVLRDGMTRWTKLRLTVLKVTTFGGVPEMLRLMFYRPELFGTPFSAATDVCLRGPSSWSHGEREAMAVVVSRANTCPFCYAAHEQTARDRAAHTSPEAALEADNHRLTAALVLAEALTVKPRQLSDPLSQCGAAGLSRRDIEDVIAVTALFNLINRIVNAFDFALPTPHQMRVGSFVTRYLGYSTGVRNAQPLIAAARSPLESVELPRAHLLEARCDTPVEHLSQLIERARHTTLGEAPPADDLDEGVALYADTVVRHSYRVTDRQIDELLTAGYSQDAVLEITIAAALGAGLFRRDWGLAALDRWADERRERPVEADRSVSPDRAA